LTDGSTISIPILLHSTAFHSVPASIGGDNEEEHSEPEPALSMSDHPTTNTPCYALHPCQTKVLMEEILNNLSLQDELEHQNDWRRKWLESWIMIVGTVVDLSS
jgi:ubiquitin-like-conjugating enzyme ATG10